MSSLSPHSHRSRPRPLVVFDFDGTLADTWRDIARALERTLAERELPPMSDEELRFAIGEGVLPLLERAVPEIARDATQLDSLYQRFRGHYDLCCLDTTRLYAGIAACLARCGVHDLAVASNKPNRFLEPMLRGLGIANHFRAVLGGDTLPVRKPDPAIWDYLHRRVPGPPDRPLWMVGDSAVDVATGRAGGARTIGCAWGLRGEAELLAAGVDHLVRSPEEICDLVAEGRR